MPAGQGNNFLKDPFLSIEECMPSHPTLTFPSEGRLDRTWGAGGGVTLPVAAAGHISLWTSTDAGSPARLALTGRKVL